MARKYITRDNLFSSCPYKAVYAIVTSNIFDPDGTDGHTAWCIAILQRDDISAVLLAQAR